MNFIDEYLAESLAAMAAFQGEPRFAATLVAMADAITSSLQSGGTLYLCGNGGSAADAQHLAGEFVGRFYYDRPPLSAVALTTDSSILTAVANDYGYEAVFERQVLALGRRGDVLLGISTSGRSANVLRALAAAAERGMACLGFSGADGGPMRAACSLLLEPPSACTPIVQQLHITAGHAVCALVERTMFPV